jgi:hypothetical protein
MLWLRAGTTWQSVDSLVSSATCSPIVQPAYSSSFGHGVDPQLVAGALVLPSDASSAHET